MKYRYIIYTMAVTIALLPYGANTVQAQPSAPKQTQSQLIELLKSKATTDVELHTQAEALRELTRIATPDAVPAIIPFLGDPKLSTHARTAMMNLPRETALAALRPELARQKGGNLAGLVQLLGTLRDSGSVQSLIPLSDDSDVAVSDAALLSLGKIGTPEAVATLVKRMESDKPAVRRQAANAIVLYTYTAIKSGKTSKETLAPLDAIVLSRHLPEFVKVIAWENVFSVPHADENSVRTAADLLFQFIQSEDRNTFELGLSLLKYLVRWSADAQTRFFDRIESISPERQIRIWQSLEMLGDRGIDLDIPMSHALKLVQNDQVEKALRAAGLKFLGAAIANPPTEKQLELGRLFSTFLSSRETELVVAASSALCRPKSEKWDNELISLLKNGNEKTRPTLLAVMGNRRRAVLAATIRPLMTDSSSAVRVAAWTAFSKCAAIHADDLALLLDQKKPNATPEEISALNEALLLACKRTPDTAKCVSLLWDRFQKADVSYKCFIISLLVQIGNENALKAIVQCAMDKEDAVADQATKVLGEWINLDAAAALLELAQKHPVNKYRIRTARGYLRLVRQMGQTADQKVAMANQIAPFLVRNEEKKLLADLYSQIENTRTDKLIFNGQNFDGWEGDTAKLFRIEDGAVVAGSLKEKIPRNEFLCTRARYSDFTLTLECKIEGEGGNAGIQFRSDRIPNHHEMIGYQADMTSDGAYWGHLYDESRRSKMLVNVDDELIKKIYKPGQWNRYKIVCWGNQVQIWLNDVLTVNYFENENVAKDGVIGLQVHGGPPTEARYRNIRIEPYVLKAF